MTPAAKRILVIENEQIVARDLNNILKRLGYATLGPATTGREAIQLAEQTKPDLILMDVKLNGGMDGVEASHEIVRN
ncbi:MAG: response regulator, partial [Acidobacteriaceae bacterium]|nr:response regulator [Acidobacteriaceae bacterium]